ncbi:TAF5-like protein, partial [Plectosphaerella plurivora]
MSGTAPQGAGPGAGGPGIPGTQTPVPVPTVPAPTQAPPPPAAQPVTPGTATAAATTSTQPMSNQNLNQIVTDYLLKRGFTKTESIFRQESSHLGPDGRPIHTRFEDKGPQRYRLSINALKDWVEGNLDIYKFELAKLLWPVFVYSWMELVNQGYVEESKNLVKTYTPLFENGHADDLKVFSTITLPQQIKENATTKLYRDNKFHIPLNQHVVGNLFHFLERERDNGGAVVTFILQTYCAVDTAQRGPIEPFSFEAIFRRAQGMNLEEIDQHEGIPGVKTGVTNREALDKSVVLRLGPLPMDDELRDDLRAELADADARQPPPEGKISLLEEFEQKIKREESAEAPHRNELPLPPPRARDVAMEMAKVRENRDRFKIEGRTGGVGVPVSACMFTFHNSLGSVACIDFSNDHELVAVGTTDSYIRVWHMEGKALKSKAPHEKDLKVSNRKLIGHFGPVYSVAFSDGVQNGDTRPSFAAEGKSASSIELGPKLLLSASADGQIRLWSLDLWQCLCIYKGHDGPVFRVQWGPHGHYFLSGGWDKTARIWMQDHASAQRLLVGHDTSISAIAWHPNGTYVFTASDETDKTIRMWSVVTGSCVRVFTGHTEYVSSIVCAPNGKVLASGDSGGNIFFWDLEKGTRIKRSRGHAKGGIWSMDFSVESNVLVSGGQDGSVRLWDVELPAEGHKAIVAQSQPGGPAQPQEGDAAAPAAG